MGKKMKIWLIVASSLVIAGLILFTTVMTAYNWDFKKLSTAKFETNTYTLTETFGKISVITDTADIVFTPSKDGKCTVTCYEITNANHLVSVQNDTLYIHVQNERKWYEYIGITLGSPKITVSLPRVAYDALLIHSSTGDVNVPSDVDFEVIDISTNTGDVTSYGYTSDVLKIKTDTGNICVKNVSANNIILTVSTGDTHLAGIQCKSLTTKGSTGDISLTNVITTERFSIERSTGDVTFDRCDAPEIFVKTDTGDVTGSLLSEKIFTAKTSTGKVSVPQSVTGGNCSVTTSTGDIRLELQTG